MDWQALERLEALARLRKVVEEAGWVCGEGSQAQYDALMADLERALIERMAALEVLRFATPGHCKELRDRDLKVNVSVILDDAEGRRRLKGTMMGLFEARVQELSEPMGDEY